MYLFLFKCIFDQKIQNIILYLAEIDMFCLKIEYISQHFFLWNIVSKGNVISVLLCVKEEVGGGGVSLL